jgi:hypothetical protein
VGILLGELVLVRRSDYHWAFDFGQQNAALATPCLAGRPRRSGNFPDFEDTARTSYVRCTGTPYRILNHLGREVLDAISGAHEVASREQ